MSTTQEVITRKPATLRQRIEGPDFKAAIAHVLPKHCSPDRFVRVAILALSKVPGLAECDPMTVLSCLMKLSQWGLEPDGYHAHLIPFKNRKRGLTECQLIVDYKGLAALVRRDGSVSKIH